MRHNSEWNETARHLDAWAPQGGNDPRPPHGWKKASKFERHKGARK
jgi:hypothetical protein